MAISPTRFSELRSSFGISQKGMANKLGVTDKYVGMIERGEKLVEEDSPLGLLFQMIEESAAKAAEAPTAPPSTKAPSRSPKLAEDVAPYRVRSPGGRLIPVLGWAHAGEAATYEELPESWQDKVPTECRDVKAFAVRLEGESMEPKFSEGDLLILQPSKQPYNGCLAVCRFQNDGIVFRRLDLSPGKVRLMALNPSYPPSEHSPEDFSWIYPVWGRWTQIWK